MVKLKSAFNEAKALAAIAYVARERPGLTPFYVSKIFYLAEKWHINRYGRPIVADTYVAMTQGPVPSTIKYFIDKNWDRVWEPEGLDDAITVVRGNGLPKIMPGPAPPSADILSESDKECLREAIAFCEGKTTDELSDVTHLHKAWLNANTDQPMDYADFVDDNNPNRAEILEIMEESAAHGVL